MQPGDSNPRPVPEIATQEQLAFDAGPVVLVGDPRHCDGLLRVRNPGASAIKVRRIALESDARELRDACADARLEVPVSVMLCAGESRLVRLRLRLPPGTPPGCYDARLLGHEKSACPVQIHVLERRKTRFAPLAITREVAPGSRFSLPLQVANLGNIPIAIPAGAAIELHAADRGWPHHFHAAAAAEGEHGHQAFLDAFVHRMARDEPGVGRAKVVAGSGPLPPQSGRVIELELAMPAKLRSGRIYRGLVRLAGSVLRMTLHVTDQDEAREGEGGEVIS